MIFVVAALLAGCAKTEIVSAPDREISFSVGSYAPSTKAVEVTEFTSFSSKGFLHAEGVADVQNFFGTAGETITNDGNGIWEPSHPYYWPKGESSYINFVSWFDKNGTPSEVTESTISWTDRTFTPDDNILVAKKAWNQKGNALNYFTPGVPTIFQHILAKVEFKAKAAMASETVDGVTVTWSVDVDNVTLKGIYNNGSITLTSSEEPEVAEGEPCVSDWAGSWTVSGDPVNVSGTAATISGTSPVSIVAPMNVLPQTINGKSISFDYTITTTSTKGTNTVVLQETMSSGDLALSSFTGDSGNWDINKYVVYTITINTKTGAITVQPTVSDIDTSLILNVE